jgi:hypothetical protein
MRGISRSITARAVLAAGIAGAAAQGAFAEDGAHGAHVPAPAYVYDHNRGPVWTSNGWTYPPVSSVHPATPPTPPPPVTPTYGCSPLERIPLLKLFLGHAGSGC